MKKLPPERIKFTNKTGKTFILRRMATPPKQRGSKYV